MLTLGLIVLAILVLFGLVALAIHAGEDPVSYLLFGGARTTEALIKVLCVVLTLLLSGGSDS